MKKNFQTHNRIPFSSFLYPLIVFLLFFFFRSIFQDMVSMDTLVIKVIDFAQHLVQADRASLFLLDSKTNELYARIFDFGYSESDETGNQIKKPQGRDVRFPVGIGIAGYVAKTGQLLNISDAYADPRFNRSVDQITGYKTKSILCMPIFLSPGIVIGVVQMVNKKTGTFTKVKSINMPITS